MWYAGLRRVTRGLPSEWLHEQALHFLSHPRTVGMVRALWSVPPQAPQKLMGLTFPSPLGLAGGLDKNARAVPVWFALGFGFVEVGTVTPLAQAGNPKPRLWRLDQHEALINAMGFNNEGVVAVSEHLKALPAAARLGPVGVNLGKNKTTPLAQAPEAYAQAFHVAAPVADYITTNISSPNTPGLRCLQGSPLSGLLRALKTAQQEHHETHGRYVPLVLKVSPDLNETDIEHTADLLQLHEVDGLIATNTTTTREGLPEGAGQPQGGLSGAPLWARSGVVLAAFRQALGPHFPIIASGGVMGVDEILAKRALGANLVQVYSGLVHRGPSWLHEAIRAWAAS